jgi:tRNA 5-methylaminomethyl-2-thiouridine biosynthesis bifunctional protein
LVVAAGWAVKTAPITAASITFDAEGVPSAPAFGDVYHSRIGALEQARAVFLQGNGLPERWQGRSQFTIVETGFGLGNNFLATWAAWKEDTHRCERLLYVSLEKHPPSIDDLQRAHAGSPLRSLAQALIDAWPPLTPNLHPRVFEQGRVRLLLGWGDAATLAREVVARADAFYLDGFAPARNEAMWSAPLFKALSRLAAPSATAATWSAARAVKDGLAANGFEVRSATGVGGKRDITTATLTPRAAPRVAAARQAMRTPPRDALIIGAGLAGAATARALVQRGVRCTVIDGAAQPAAGASGNPAGLFHGTLSADDGLHARWYRAASFMAAQAVREALAEGVTGAVHGFLRLEDRLSISAMRSQLQALGLPDTYVQALDAQQASDQCGQALHNPAWFYPEGGWVDPSALVALWLRATHWIGNTQVQRIEHDGSAWHALDAQGQLIAAAPLMVLANAHDALRLAQLPAQGLQQRRGQLSWATSATAWLQRPVASGGYVLQGPNNTVVMGATQQVNDTDAAVRHSDHAHNLERARHLLPAAPLPSLSALQGRVAWRATSRDRLPLIGPVPTPMHTAAQTGLSHPSQRRRWPRQPGLWLHTGLGSRGITTAALGGELIAAQVFGEPWPLEADVCDAVDPARL